MSMTCTVLLCVCIEQEKFVKNFCENTKIEDKNLHSMSMSSMNPWLLTWVFRLKGSWQNTLLNSF